MSTTDDRNDPALRDIDPDTHMQAKYLVLSDEERAKGFVEPVRRSYRHERCGAVTTMGQAIAETYARQPEFYGGTYCAQCGDHFPVGAGGEFVWDGTHQKVGTRRPEVSLPEYVYVASSWRNPAQPAVVQILRAAGIDCYDFRHPAPGESGFAWSEIDPDWQHWTADQYVRALNDPIAEHGYRRDFAAMQRADTFVLVLPCGRSAHLELGWAVGAGKRTAILTQDGEEPELMAKMVDHIATSTLDLLGWLGVED